MHFLKFHLKKGSLCPLAIMSNIGYLLDQGCKIPTPTPQFGSELPL